jgi:hypothetical protein
MRIALLALFLIASATSALAQAHPSTQSTPEGFEGRGKHRSSASSAQNAANAQRKALETEKAYNETIKHIPVQKPADPWGKMR